MLKYTDHVLTKCANVMDEQRRIWVCTPEPTIEKRPRSSPTNLTPHRDPKRTPLRVRLDCDGNQQSPRVLSESFDHPKRRAGTQDKWSNEEVKALTEFVLFHSEGNSWPTHKEELYWQSTSQFVHGRSGQSFCRSGEYSPSRFKYLMHV